MKTDKQLFKIFTNMPEFFFDLTGIDYQANYTFKSETIKEISRSMDGLIEPDDLTKPHCYKEVLKMMSLTTPLEDTVAYKELVAIGEKIGERKGERKGKRKGERD